MLRQETKELCEEIYIKRGFWKQIPWLKSEFFEMLEALQKFIIDSSERNLMKALEEIADFEVVKQQLSQSEGEKRTFFLEKIQTYDSFITGEGLKELYKNLLKVHTGSIKAIAHEKAVRAMKRIEAGYYG